MFVCLFAETTAHAWSSHNGRLCFPGLVTAPSLSRIPASVHVCRHRHDRALTPARHCLAIFQAWSGWRDLVLQCCRCGRTGVTSSRGEGGLQVPTLSRPRFCFFLRMTVTQASHHASLTPPARPPALPHHSGGGRGRGRGKGEGEWVKKGTFLTGRWKDWLGSAVHLQGVRSK